MKTISLVCAGCGAEFEKPKKEHTRRVKQGHDKFFCTMSCAGKTVLASNIDHSVQNGWVGSAEHKDHLKKLAEQNEKPFNRYIRRLVNRDKQDERGFNLTAEYLEELWNKQGGRCAYTGLPMSHPHWSKATDSFITASVDRIDSAGGYVEGNVQFVIRALNYAKNTAPDGDFRTFLEKLRVALNEKLDSKVEVS